MIPSSTLLPSLALNTHSSATRASFEEREGRIPRREIGASPSSRFSRISFFTLRLARERFALVLTAHRFSRRADASLRLRILSLSLFRSDDGTTLLDDTLARSIASAGTLTRLGDSTSDCGRTHESTRDSNDLAGARRGDSWSRAEPSPYEPFPSR